MKELEQDRSWDKAPIIALLVGGLLAGGGWEIVANMDAPEVRYEIIEVEAPAPVLVIPPPPMPIRHAIIPPQPPAAPPPVEERVDLSAEPTFTPFTVAPSILNRSEVVRAMQHAYPPWLRDAGIGGTVRVYFFIQADGTVGKIQLDQRSGHDELDQGALAVAAVYRFSPALNRGDAVPVWVSFPITFQVR